MSAHRPMVFAWDGEVMKPRHSRLADQAYVVGETYTLAAYEERSASSHNHEFAWIGEAWRNLPEQFAESYPTPEHLRKRALIEAGFYDEIAIDAGSKAAALRVMQAFKAFDDFALVFLRDSIVIIRTAKSQSRRKMGKDDFQKSKTAILEIISGMIGVEPEALRAQRAA